MQTKRIISNKEAMDVGVKLGIKWDKFSVEEFKNGMEVELEHGLASPETNVTNDNLQTTGKIALAHLNEIPDYYTRLLKMEKEAVANP